MAVERIEKNRREHVHPLRDDLRETLKAHKPADAKAADRVFVGLWGRVGLRWLEDDLRKAGVPVVEQRPGGIELRCDFHSLRHTSETWAGEKCPSLTVLMAHLNHKTPSQTARYVHVRDRVSAELVNQLPSFGGTEIGTAPNVSKRQIMPANVTDGQSGEVAKTACFPMKNAISSKETASLSEVPPRGVEQPQDSSGKPYLTDSDGAKSGALSGQLGDMGTELAFIVSSWASLPPALRAGIVAMVHVSTIQ